MVIYLHPFRIIKEKGMSAWSASIDEVNSREWDYVKLHEVMGGIDVGLPAPYHMLVGRDGALALPPIPKLHSDQQAVEFFNRCLAAILLGGVYCSAVTLDNLEFGSIIDWKYLRTHGNSVGGNRFHTLIRMKMAPPIEAIALNSPPVLDFDKLRGAIEQGLKILNLTPQLSPEFLLKGISGIARRDWGVGLSNLWITVEQLTEALWVRHLLQPLADDQDRVPGRLDQLKDTRTWTAANRHEILHLKGLITKSTLQELYTARKSRNDLSHRGTHPSEASAKAAYAASLALLATVVGDIKIPLSKLDLSNHSISDPFKPKDRVVGEPQYWMPIPKLPGEDTLEKEEAEGHKED